MKSSYAFKGNFLPQERPITDDAACELFADAIGGYSYCFVGKAAGPGVRTPEAAKKWKAKASAPGLAPIINVASTIPSVEWMLRTEIEVRKRGGDPTRFVTELVTDLLRIVEGGGPLSARARGSLQEISRLLMKPPSEAPAVSSRPVSPRPGSAVSVLDVPSCGVVETGGVAIASGRSPGNVR